MAKRILEPVSDGAVQELRITAATIAATALSGTRSDVDSVTLERRMRWLVPAVEKYLLTGVFDG